MLRIVLLLLLALLPSGLKIPLYRLLFHWKIGRRVTIGLSLIDASEVTIGDRVCIGHFNRIQRIPRLSIGNGTFIGNRNVFITGSSRYVASVHEANPQLDIGEECYIIGPHYFDVHAPLHLDSSVTLAGQGSCFYTHGLDYRIALLTAEPITIGENCYVGAHVLFAPGTRIAPNTIVGMGALVTKAFEEQYVLVGGSPARVVKQLDPQADWFTRNRPGRQPGDSAGLATKKGPGTGDADHRNDAPKTAPRVEEGMGQTPDYAAKRAYQDQRVAKTYEAQRFHSWRGRWVHALELRAVQRALTRAGPLHRILDLPCGTARLMLPLITQRPDLWGADISWEMLQRARVKLADLGADGQGRLVRCDAASLPFADGVFDCVVSLRFMGHLPPDTRRHILREMKRISRRWLVVAFYLSDPVFRLRRVLRKAMGRPYSAFPMTWLEIGQDLDATGLRLAGVFPVLRFHLSETHILLLVQE